MKIILKGKSLSLNHMYGQTRAGRRYLSDEGKELKKSWGWDAKSQGGVLLSSTVAVTVRLYFPDYRRRDSQNFLKLVYDAFTGVLWEDDSLIVEEHIYKSVDKTNPRIELEYEGLQK